MLTNDSEFPHTTLESKIDVLWLIVTYSTLPGIYKIPKKPKSKFSTMTIFIYERDAFILFHYTLVSDNVKELLWCWDGTYPGEGQL